MLITEFEAESVLRMGLSVVGSPPKPNTISPPTAASVGVVMATVLVA